MYKPKNKVIIVTGPPGSGKGTQANLLAETLGLYHLETSRIFEEKFEQGKKGEFVVFDGQKFFLEDERKRWLEGKLFSPPFVVALLTEKVSQIAKIARGIIFSGSPRTLYEAKRLLPLLIKIYGKENIHVILLSITPKETIFRNSHRKICELMRHSILYSNDTKKLKYCPLDGSKLLRREGLDDPSTIKRRIKEYKENTLPILDYYERLGINVKKINGSPPPAIVFKKILKYLKCKK